MAQITTNNSYKSILLQKIFDFDTTDTKTYDLNGGTPLPYVRIEFQSSGLDLTKKQLVFENTNPTVADVIIEAKDINQHIDLYSGAIPSATIGYSISGKLTNGSSYRCYLRVVDGSTVIKSNIQQFTCYPNPQITISSITDKNDGTATVSFTYEQSTAKGMHEYRCIVKEKDERGNYNAILDTGYCYGYSTTIYNEETATAYIQQSLNGLSDGKDYRYIVTARSDSQNGFFISSCAEFHIAIRKVKPSTVLELKKSEHTVGAVNVSADIKKIVGESTREGVGLTDNYESEVINGVVYPKRIVLLPDGDGTINSVVFAENFGEFAGYPTVESLADVNTNPLVFCMDIKNPVLFEPCLILGKKELIKNRVEDFMLSAILRYKCEVNKHVFRCEVTDAGISDIKQTTGVRYVSGQVESADITDEEFYKKSFPLVVYNPFYPQTKEYYFEFTTDGDMGVSVRSNSITFASEEEMKNTMIRVLLKLHKSPTAYSIEIKKLGGATA